MVEKRKEKVVNEISNLTASMNPINYMNKKRELEKFIEINSKDTEEKEEIIIKLQEEFIKTLKDNCFETENIQSLKNLIFKIRYYKFLYVFKDKQIKDIEQLNENIDIVLKQVIQKLVLAESIRRISKDDKLNQEIINNILDTKVIDLLSLKFEIDVKENCLKIKTYEKEVFEKEFEIMGEFSRKSFEVKQGRTYKLFI